MELARRKGLEHDIAFPGRLDDATMIEALCTCDVCLNTDLATEMNDKSTMNKIIEYMALGRPIVFGAIYDPSTSRQVGGTWVRDPEGTTDAVAWTSVSDIEAGQVPVSGLVTTALGMGPAVRFGA